MPEKLKILESSCFSDCFSLKKIALPQTLEKIGTDCFVCIYDGLETITIPASVKEIGKSAFGDYNSESKFFRFCIEKGKGYISQLLQW